jgi:hypothetical protein
MQSFSKKIAVSSDGMLTFYFTQIYTVKGLKYFVFVADKNFISYQFSIFNVGKFWVIAEPQRLPVWITELESVFEDAIIENKN